MVFVNFLKAFKKQKGRPMPVNSQFSVCCGSWKTSKAPFNETLTFCIHKAGSAEGLGLNCKDGRATKEAKCVA